MSSRRFQPLHCIGIAAILLLLVLRIDPIWRFRTNLEPNKFPAWHYPKQDCGVQREILTAFGRQTYDELDEQVFQRFGFKIAQNCTPFPVLDWITPLDCNSVFRDWLRIAENADPQSIPIRSLPVELQDDYLLNGISLLTSMYRNDKSSSDSKVDRRWTAESIESSMRMSDVYMTSGYDQAAACVQTAFQRYRDRVETNRGLVVGSINPWVEVLALQNGALSITTAEYRKIAAGDSRLEYVHPIELARDWQRYANSFDFIASFSSIEHSGLGRYGDPSDPIGDLREMQKFHCLLKRGSVVFVGFPVGQDEIVFNLHRIYGAVRLALMFAGFRLLDVFYGDQRFPYELKINDLEYRGGIRQFLFVLEKN